MTSTGQSIEESNVRVGTMDVETYGDRTGGLALLLRRPAARTHIVVTRFRLMIDPKRRVVRSRWPHVDPEVA